MQDAVDIRFTKNELNSLVKRKGTCVTLERKTRVVFLLPSQLSDIKAGIRENLDSNLLKYDYETKAILIGYEKIKILSKYGSICYGYSKIALRIEANFYLFKPAVGRLLQGVVCKQSGRHIGCLVHKGFNVSVPLEDGDCGWDFSIGQDVKFTVVKLDLTSGPLPYILGQLCVKGADNGAVARGIGGGVTEGGRNIDDGGEDGPQVEDGMRTPEPSQPLASPLAKGDQEVTPGGWHKSVGGVSTPPRDTSAEKMDGRNSLINQLLRTVEKSIAEVGEVGSPKKSKQKRLSLSPQSPGPKGPRAPSVVLPFSPPSGKGEERQSEGNGSVLMTPQSPSGGAKGGNKRAAVSKKGAVDSGVGDSDTGSIIDRLLEMSRRELLGSEGGTPKGRKRKAEEGPGEEGGSRRKLSRKVDGSPAQVPAVPGETPLQPNAKWHRPAEDPVGGVFEHGGTPVSSEKSVPSKTHRLSLSKVILDDSVSNIKKSNFGLSTPELLQSTKPALPSRVKRKSLPVKLEIYKQEK